MKKDNQSPILTKKTPTIPKYVLDNLDVFIPWVLRHPRYLWAFARLARAYKRTQRSRAKELADGLRVPPFLILSITPRCNLNCEGCYAAAVGTTYHRNSNAHARMKSPLNWEQWHAIIAEASELGVFYFIIAGGEPFLFPGLIEFCEEFKDRFFLILTNGTALSDADYKRLKRSTNIVISVSIEGGRKLTDVRRGQGVYEKALNTLKYLGKIGVPTGISVTINRMNYKYWMNTEHIDSLIAQGVRLGLFIEYIPLTPGLAPEPESLNQLADNMNEWTMKNDHILMLNTEERAKFRLQILNYRATKPIYLIHSPGDEELLGGCVSAGRGFAHITPEGDLTPCPVSNIATHNLTTTTLREGLASQLFKEICESEHLLETEDTPCALFAHPKEVDALAKSVGAYRTDY